MQKLLTVLVFSVFVLYSSSPCLANDDEQVEVTVTEVVAGSFGSAWAAVKRTMETFSCGKPQQERVTEPAEVDGFYKGLYVSDYCILKTGEDSTKKVLELYGKVPRIRGGIWINGRVQFKVSVREEERGRTKVVLKAELSGFEEFITNGVHFWASNGILERRAMDIIIKFTAEEAQKARSSDD